MKAAVLGLGNVLRRDDGFGPSAVQRLADDWEFPANVELQDLGTPGLDLPAHLLGFDAVIVLDALADEEHPGALQEIDLRTLRVGGARSPSMTGHEGDLLSALLVAEVEGRGPSLAHLVGVGPADTGDGTGLSPPVRAAIEPACERVVDQLRRWGIAPIRRKHVRYEGGWWERGAGEVTPQGEGDAARGG